MNSNINFAMTFPPERSLINGLLQIADGFSERSVEEISSFTGIPMGKSTGKVKPNIDYAQAMGIINYKVNKGNYILSKTDIGQVIYKEDFGIIEELTLQMVNYFLSSNSIGSILWNLIVRDKYVGQGDYVDNMVLSDKLTRVFGKPNDQQNRVITPFKSAHKDFFQTIKFVEENKDKRIKLNKLNVNKRYIYMYAYTLLFDWEYIIRDNDSNKVPVEIEFERIKSDLNWGAGFHWDEKTVFEVLELMAEKHIIKLNKQLFPMTVIKNIESIEIVDKLYSLL